MHARNIHTWPTRVLINVFRSLLSLCSVTLICCLIISAEVISRRGLNCGTVIDIPAGGLPWLDSRGEPRGELGFDPHELVRRDDGNRLNIFNPNARFIRLVTAIPTPGGLIVGDPGSGSEDE